jgi:hypothetical protein
MFFHPKNLKSDNNKPRFNILLHTQSIVCAKVESVFRVLGIYNFGPNPTLTNPKHNPKPNPNLSGER